jgi:hypothetical protein
LGVADIELAPNFHCGVGGTVLLLLHLPVAVLPAALLATTDKQIDFWGASRNSTQNVVCRFVLY